MPGLPTSNLQLDILMGRDETVENSDVFEGTLTSMRLSSFELTDCTETTTQTPQNLHAAMEKKRNM